MKARLYALALVACWGGSVLAAEPVAPVGKVMFERMSDGGHKSTQFVEKARRLYPTATYRDYANSVVQDWTWQDDDVSAVPEGEVVAPIRGTNDVRWCRIPNAVNVRDLGGWNGLRTGQVYRGSQLFTNAVGGVSRETREAIATLGIRTDVDLRGWDEASKTETKSFEEVGLRRLHRQIVPYYRAFTNAQDAAALGRALAEFAKPENYPIYFHCKAGADRTGTLAFVLEGLCGVSETDLAIDYELTSCHGGHYTRIRNIRYIGEPLKDNWRMMVDLVKAYPGRELKDRFAALAKDRFGLTDGQIEAIRRMLERRGE